MIYKITGDKIMRALLTQMYKNLSESLSCDALPEERCKNYESQLRFYDKIFSMESQGEEREKVLVCARCFLSISRSVMENRYTPERLLQAKKELSYLEPIFENGRGTIRAKIRKTAQERINRLSRNDPDEMADSVLFLYLSLMQL